MSDERELLKRINDSLLREDTEPFERVRILGGEVPVKVWHRFFAGDFMASCFASRKGKRHRLITTTGIGLNEALANLATVIADYVSPSGIE